MSDQERSDTEAAVAGEPTADVEDINDAPTKAGSKAATKRKKKKEKEKAMKKAQAVDSDEERSDTEQPKSLETAVEAQDENDVRDEEVKDEATEESKSAAKRKKDKRKEKEKEKKSKDDDKDAKKKGNKRADLIREMLRRREEAEEEARRQVEEEERRLEEERLEREREEKLAVERKEEEKRKKAELIAKQKREGTFLTKKQKQDLQRARTFLQNQNIVVPAGSGGAEDGGEKPKKPYYGKKKNVKKAAEERLPAVEAAGTTPEHKSPELVEEELSEPIVEEEEEVEEIADDWEQIAEAVETKSPEPKSCTDKPVQRAAQKLGKLDVGKEEDDASSADELVGSESSSVDEESIDTSSMAQTTSKETKEELFARVRAKITERRTRAEANRNPNNLRSPVICVLGHVDTGKTKMLDTIRRTHVQDSEAGGITQQIGATRVPAEAIKERCRMVKKYHRQIQFDPDEVKIPGFLIIDTPGHESFANLRSRGSSLCDIAILVVDLMHGLEPQTIESLKLLKERKTPFIVALNKIDRLYGYESNPRKDIWLHMTAQAANTQMEFKDRYETIVGEFAEQGINIIHAFKNKDYREYVSVVPTSAMDGDGIGNLMAHLVDQSQTRLAKKLIFSDELDCTVMEVRSLPGLGTTIDVILVNGTLHINDAIVLTGTEGAIVTSVRDLLMPQPLKEIRVKNEYEHYKEIKGSQGVKVLAKYLDKTVAGLPLYVAHSADEIDVLREDAEEQLQRALTSINRKQEGVYVQASTLGSLEALLAFLDSQKIPYSNVNIGPVHKLDVQKAAAMLQHNSEFACILAFDVPVDKDVQAVADREGVRIFQADIIYHLEDSFLKYREELREKRKKEHEHLAIFPCKLTVLPQHIFNARNPIVCGVRVEAGTVRKGTPIVAHTSDGVVFLGSVSSIERNHEQVDSSKAGEEACIKIENTTGEAPKLYGRHFTHTDPLISRINRESIDVCKTYFRDDLSKADWQLVIQLKRMLGIM